MVHNIFISDEYSRKLRGGLSEQIKVQGQKKAMGSRLNPNPKGGF